jgi:hypothetical protein
MRNAAMLTLATLLGAIALSSNAHAKAEYVTYLPNGGVHTCENCHPGGNTLAINLFGQEASNQVGKPITEWWPALVDSDSDGDGQTNGQEMGDPCGDWLIGLDPPRTTDISNPGDAADVSADPDSPTCDGGAGGAGGSAVSSSSSATTGSGGDSGTGGSGSGNGSGNGSGTGAGSGPPSTGAGRADPPVSTAGSCAMNPATPGASWDIGLLAGAALMLARCRRRKRR